MSPTSAVTARAISGGRAGQAMVVKLAANLLVGLHTAAAAEALGLVRKAGLDPGPVLDVLTASAGTSRMLAHARPGAQDQAQVLQEQLELQALETWLE